MTRGIIVKSEENFLEIDSDYKHHVYLFHHPTPQGYFRLFLNYPYGHGCKTASAQVSAQAVKNGNTVLIIYTEISTVFM